MYTDNFETRTSRFLRRYPLLAIVGLAIIFLAFVTMGKPMLAYLVNSFHRASYHDIFNGAEGTVEAQQAWAEYIAELNAISDMGWMGKLLVSVPSILRIGVYVLAIFLMALAVYFLITLWEASLDYGFWDLVLTGVLYILKGIYMIAKATVFFLAIVAVRTYYCTRRLCRKGRKAYRRVKCHQKPKSKQ